MAKPSQKDNVVPLRATPTILVVEDELLVRVVIAEYLRDCGYKVVEAPSADDAVKVLQSKIKIDLVFTDVQLPGGMNGFALAGWINANRLGMKVIMTSGYARAAEQAGELCETGPFLRKPYEPQHVVIYIRRLLADSV